MTPLHDCLAQLGVGKDEFDHLVLRPETGGAVLRGQLAVELDNKAIARRISTVSSVKAGIDCFRIAARAVKTPLHLTGFS